METAKSNLRKEIKEKTTGYILAAFGFVAGLAWNDAIKSLIDLFFPTLGNVLIKFVYAVLVTVVIVVITIYVLRFTNKETK